MYVHTHTWILINAIFKNVRNFPFIFYTFIVTLSLMKAQISFWEVEAKDQEFKAIVLDTERIWSQPELHKTLKKYTLTLQIEIIV